MWPSCGPGRPRRQQTDYFAALELARTFQVTGDRLDLFREGGNYAVTYMSG